MDKNKKEIKLLALLYKVEELLVELKDGGEESQDYKDLSRIIKNLEDYLQGEQDVM